MEGTITIPRGLRKYRVTVGEDDVEVEMKKRMHHFSRGYSDVGRWRPVTVDPIDKRTALVIYEAVDELLQRSDLEDSGE